VCVCVCVCAVCSRRAVDVHKSFFFAKLINAPQCALLSSADELPTTKRLNLARVRATFIRRMSERKPMPFPA
jgi:hypothetical protein